MSYLFFPTFYERQTTNSMICTCRCINQQALLLKMPGVTTKNIHRLMNRVRDLVELVALTEEQLAEALDSAGHARSLHAFLHRQHTPSDGATVAQPARSGASGKRAHHPAGGPGTKRRK